MKLLGKTKDQAIGSLLRAYVSRPTNPHQLCTDFDPDFATSYIEGKLTASARSRYEVHLSECVACRKAAVSLALLARAESSTSTAQTGSRDRAGWLASAGNLVRALSAPQWAMAAAAVVVLAVSLPLLLSRNQATPDRSEVRIDQASPTETAQTQPLPGSAEGGGVHAATPSARVPASDSRQGETRKPEPTTVNGILAGNSSPTARQDQTASGELQKNERRSQTQFADQLQVKSSEAQITQAPAQPGQAQAETQQAKKDSAQQQEKDVAQNSERKPVASDSAAADNKKAQLAESAAPPPEAPKAAESNRPLGRSRARLGLRDSSSNESVPPRNADREIRGKKFFLKDGTWTDRDYSPDKDLPIITLIRDSNVYKEVLSKRTSLKPYLDQFAVSERAIIVFKGTVYKLIPQTGDK